MSLDLLVANAIYSDPIKPREIVPQAVPPPYVWQRITASVGSRRLKKDKLSSTLRGAEPIYNRLMIGCVKGD